MTSSGGGDVIILGDGLVGLCCARSLARRGASVLLLGQRLPGIASPAAAGLLAPTIEARDGAVHRFAVEARDRYRDVVDELAADTGLTIDLQLDGILRVALDEEELTSLRDTAPPSARLLSPREVHELEPGLDTTLGGVLHVEDGMVDNVALLSALDADCARRGLRRVVDRARSLAIAADGALTIEGLSGRRFFGRTVVVACGAWVNDVTGLPRRLPVEPLRGQMVGFRDVGIRRPVYGAGGYVAPRRGRMTMAGGTAEAVGFDPGTTSVARTALTEIAQRLVPALRRDSPTAHWSGLRPMTSSGLPILGRDPLMPNLVYACGHSRNGVLLAPQTGEVMAELLDGGRAHPVLGLLAPDWSALDRLTK